MNKQETLEKNGFDFEKFKADNEYSARNILKAMEEYGKHCAEQAWIEAIQQHSLLSLSNMVNGQFEMKSPEDWWNDFIKKEATE